MTYNLGKTSTGRPIAIAGRFAARHGLIAGATGTGKSYTIARLVEQMTGQGIPCFLVDVKGDLSGIARLARTRFLDPFGQSGAPFHICAADMGADMIARALGLTEAQSGALDILFSFARDRGIDLASLADMSAALATLESRRKAIGARYGHLTSASVGVVRRALLRLEGEGIPLFGRPSLDPTSCLATPGTVTLIDGTRLYQSGALYGAAMLYILDSLYRGLPEIGDAEKPRLAVFIDEAHLVFSDLAPPLLARIERIVRLIRSKGVALFFASQSPSDLPPAILAQLGNRIQHGLRGATQADLRGIRAAAETMPLNPAIDASSVITRLGVGQALVSTIGSDGVPTPVEIVQIAAPRVPLTPIDQVARMAGAPAVSSACAKRDPGQWALAMMTLAILLAWVIALHLG